MTTTEIEIAIAKTRGWEPIHSLVGTLTGWRDPDKAFWPEYIAPQYTQRRDDIINYIKETLKDEQARLFIQKLVQILDREHSNGEITLTDVCDEVDISYHILMSTPLQLSEAFLRTLDLWKE